MKNENEVPDDDEEDYDEEDDDEEDYDEEDFEEEDEVWEEVKGEVKVKQIDAPPMVEKDIFEHYQYYKIPQIHNVKPFEPTREYYIGYKVPSTGDAIFKEGANSEFVTCRKKIRDHTYDESCIGELYSRMTPEEQNELMANFQEIYQIFGIR